MAKEETMAVPVLVCLCAFATWATDITATTTISMDDKSIAVIVPVKEKDKYINITVVTRNDEDQMVHGDAECFEEDVVNEAAPILDEKKTEQGAKPAK